MALHLAANGCYGVMIYNNKDYPDSYINEELKKFGKVHESQKGGKNLIFVYYKQYEEARACLDALSCDPDYNAKPAKPRETTRSAVVYGARERAKSVLERGERGRHKFEPYEKKKSNDKAEGEASNEEEVPPLRKRAISITNISLEKIENSNETEKSETKENSGPKSENTEESKLSEKTETGRIETSKHKFPYRPRSKSVGRINIEDEVKRAELINKVIKCEGGHGGSLDSLFEKEITSIDNSEQKSNNLDILPGPQLQRAKSFYGNLANDSFERHDNSVHRQRNLWLSPKPNFYKPRIDNNSVEKSEENEPFLLPAMTIYEHYVIASQPKKYSHVVVVSGLPLYITEEYLCDLCAKFAKVLRIRLVDTEKIHECRAYVYVMSKRDAINLKKNIDRKILFCHIVEVTILSDIIKVLPFINY